MRVVDECAAADRGFDFICVELAVGTLLELAFEQTVAEELQKRGAWCGVAWLVCVHLLVRACVLLHACGYA